MRKSVPIFVAFSEYSSFNQNKNLHRLRWFNFSVHTFQLISNEVSLKTSWTNYESKQCKTLLIMNGLHFILFVVLKIQMATLVGPFFKETKSVGPFFFLFNRPSVRPKHSLAILPYTMDWKVYKTAFSWDTYMLLISIL